MARSTLLGALAAVVFLAGCTTPDTGETTTAGRSAGAAPPAPAALHGEPARAARAVDVLARALRHSGHRWLVSFSDGADPLAALTHRPLI